MEDNNAKLASLKQKRADAGRKGGKAPHKCRGRQCKKQNAASTSTNTTTNATTSANTFNATRNF